MFIGPYRFMLFITLYVRISINAGTLRTHIFPACIIQARVIKCIRIYSALEILAQVIKRTHRYPAFKLLAQVIKHTQLSSAFSIHLFSTCILQWETGRLALIGSSYLPHSMYMHLSMQTMQAHSGPHTTVISSFECKVILFFIIMIVITAKKLLLPKSD